MGYSQKMRLLYGTHSVFNGSFLLKIENVCPKRNASFWFNVNKKNPWTFGILQKMLKLIRFWKLL